MLMGMGSNKNWGKKKKKKIEMGSQLNLDIIIMLLHNFPTLLPHGLGLGFKETTYLSCLCLLPSPSFSSLVPIYIYNPLASYIARLLCFMRTLKKKKKKKEIALA